MCFVKLHPEKNYQDLSLGLIVHVTDNAYCAGRDCRKSARARHLASVLYMQVVLKVALQRSRRVLRSSHERESHARSTNLAVGMTIVPVTLCQWR